MSLNVIDRRLSPQGKSLPNRQRFLRLAKAAIRDAVARSIRDHSLGDPRTEEVVSIPMQRIAEPRLRIADTGGDRSQVLPGNKTFVRGDSLPKPTSGGGGGGSQGAPDGTGEDAFRFVISADEYLDVLFDELELPDLAKTQLKDTELVRHRRLGHSPHGSPSNLNLARTMRRSLSRRIALGRPKLRDLAPMRDEIERLAARQSHSAAEETELEGLRQDLARLEARARRVGFIETVDLRYNRFEPVSEPSAQAVMFCLMDVSGSMTEAMKDLAKRFFLLLRLFLARQYDNVDIVFVRHTAEAKEVDEDTFFGGPETGGTVVSSALAEMRRIIRERYPVDEWNIYGAQASDGDNYAGDSTACLRLLTEEILPVSQYFAYVEVYDPRQMEIFASGVNVSELWRHYATVAAERPDFAMKRVFNKSDVFPVFRQLFAKSRLVA